ncbi:hypothetical protein WCWAEYFT_CDS0266 [Vibrio phage VB_VaC_TDDLMA]
MQSNQSNQFHSIHDCIDGSNYIFELDGIIYYGTFCDNDLNSLKSFEGIFKFDNNVITELHGNYPLPSYFGRFNIIEHKSDMVVYDFLRWIYNHPEYML